MPVVMPFSTAQVIDSTNSGLDGMSVKAMAVWPGAAVSAVGRAVKGLLGKAACGVGKKVQKFIPPVCKVVMIVSGAVALLSCVGWLISRKKFA